MSADRLREAARALRNLASSADSGPWFRDGEYGSEVDDLVVSDEATQVIADCDTIEENAAYIATMHPGVGLALADWLDEEASAWEKPWQLSDNALAVADAILGGAA